MEGISRNQPHFAFDPDIWLKTFYCCVGVLALVLLFALVILILGLAASVLIYLVGILWILFLLSMGLGAAAFAGQIYENNKGEGWGAPLTIGTLVIGYFVIAAISDAWRETQRTARGVMNDAQDSALFLYNEILVDLFMWAWFLVPASLLFLVATTVGVTLVLFSIGPWFMEALFRASYRCDSCRNDKWPLFVCPYCETEISDLRPTIYGVFFACCGNCDEAIPTTMISGRSKLKSKCANTRCKTRFLQDSDKIGAWHIGLAGARSSGKTTYMLACIDSLLTQDHGFLRVEIPDVNDQMLFDRLKSAYLSGGTSPTPVEVPRAFTLKIDYSASIWVKGQRDIFVKFYDVGGEVFENAALLDSHDHFEIADGVIVAMDLFALPSEKQNQPSGARVSFSDKSPVDVLTVLGHHFGSIEYNPDENVKLPTSLVITKADLLGDLAVFPESGQSMDEYSNHVETSINNLEDGWSLLEAKKRISKKASWFMSAVRDDGTGTGVTEPFFWMLEQIGARRSSSWQFVLTLFQSMFGLRGIYAFRSSMVCLVTIALLGAMITVVALEPQLVKTLMVTNFNNSFDLIVSAGKGINSVLRI